MTCVIEVLTPKLWERVKSDLGPHFRLHIERRSLDTSFIGTNRVVHMESKNYICFAPVMIRDKLSRWFFCLMNGRAICFRVDAPARPLLEFYPRSEPSPAEYGEFQSQVGEIFSTAGYRLAIPKGSVFTARFPALT